MIESILDHGLHLLYGVAIGWPLAWLVSKSGPYKRWQKRSYDNSDAKRLFTQSADYLDQMDIMFGRFDPEHAAKRRQAAETGQGKEYRESLRQRGVEVSDHD